MRIAGVKINFLYMIIMFLCAVCTDVNHVLGNIWIVGMTERFDSFQSQVKLLHPT